MNVCRLAIIESYLSNRVSTSLWISSVANVSHRPSKCQNRWSSYYHFTSSHYSLNNYVYCRRNRLICGLYDNNLSQNNLSTSSHLWSLKKTGWKESLYQKTKSFRHWLEHFSPTAKKYMDILENGAKITWRDIKTYRHVRQRLQVNPSATVTYEEDMKMYSLRRDALKVVPLVPFCLIPMGFILLTLPIYFLPRYVLPHSFWTEAQRRDFFRQMHAERMPHCKIIMSHIDYVKQIEPNESYHAILENISNTIATGNVPSNFLLLEMKQLCSGFAGPLNVETVRPPALLRAFCKVTLLNSLLPTQLMYTQLQNHITFILSLDNKIHSNNLLRDFKTSEIEIAALMRGLNSIDLSKEANIYWLKNWINLTRNCKFTDTWFILHAMVLLSMNYNEVKYQRRIFG